MEASQKIKMPLFFMGEAVLMIIGKSGSQFKVSSGGTSDKGRWVYTAF